MTTSLFRIGQRTLKAGVPGTTTRGVQACRKKFLRFFPRGFQDQKYIDWERGYKERAHKEWIERLGKAELSRLLKAGDYNEIASRAVRIEAKTNLLFSFEKMALRDAVRTPAGARRFAEGLVQFLHGRGGLERRFDAWCETLDALPRRQTRVLTWPLVTVFGFIAQPEVHMFLKPNVTRRAASCCGIEFRYVSRPSWKPYSNLLAFASEIRASLRDLKPRDQIDVQSFLWVQGSDEYFEE